MTAIAKPVRFEQTKHYLQVIDAEGSTVVTADRWAWSSSDKTLEDTIECRNFSDPEARAEAAAANAKQIAQFEEIVATLNASV